MSRKHRMRGRRVQLGTDEKKPLANINNSLNEALFPAGLGYNTQVTYGQQEVSKTNELFSDLRGYMVSNFRQLLSQAYVEIGLIQTMVDLPIDDAFRGGVEIITNQLDPDQLKELQKCIKRENDLGNLAQGMKWNRLFGGAGLVILTDQDATSSLDLSKLNKESQLEFKPADLWELFYDKMNIEGFNPAIKDPQFEYYSYYGTKLHKSRVLKMKGVEAPSFVRPRLRGWGMSVVEILIRAINQYLKGTNLIYELLDEAKLDVYLLKNLADTLLNAEGTQLVKQRIAMANRQKNYQNAIVLDSEDTYEQKAFTFAGIADVMKEIRNQVSSDLRIPQTKLFGMQATGFSDDEGSLENYNMMVESSIRQKMEPDVIRLIELRCQQQFGFIPTDLEITFKPLRIVKATEEDTIKTGQFNRLLAALTAGAISQEQFVQGCNKQNLLGVSLNNGNDSLVGGTDSDSTEDPKDDNEVTGANESASESLTPPETN